MAHVFFEDDVACASDHAAERLKERLEANTGRCGDDVDIVYDLEVSFQDLHLPIRGGISREVHMHLGAVEHRANAVLMPISWRVDGNRAFPEFHGWIEIAPLSARRATLAILGDYTPPLGVVGSALDVVGGRVIAQLTVRRLVDRLRHLLEDDPTGINPT